MNGYQLGVNGCFLLADCSLADGLGRNWVKSGMFLDMAKNKVAPLGLQALRETLRPIAIIGEFRCYSA
jgi:hypothetical protein